MRKKLMGAVVALTMLTGWVPKTYSFSADNGLWYVSWGYNKDYWTNSNIHISQPGLNNNFTVHNVSAGDDPGWNTGVFNKDLFTPQTNIRIGRFINAARTWALELSLDHTKYNTNLYQVAHVTGTINGQPVNADEVLTPNYFNYKLHNGANELMINLAHIEKLFSIPHTAMKISGVGKTGIGVMLPHPDSVILGNQSDVGPKKFSNFFGWRNGWWQFGGWTAGVELGFQLNFYKGLYLELTDKEAYTSLSDIQIYDGRASQTMWLNEAILSLGIRF